LSKHLIYEEGIRLHPYQDHLGYWTIGIGHLIDSRKGGKLPPGIDSFPISEEMAYLTLSYDIHGLEAELWLKIPYFQRLDPVRQAVLASMAFQMGVSGLLGFKRTLKFIQNGDFGAAASEMLDSKWSRQTTARATRLSHAMQSGSPHYLLAKRN
jgi:lysozyme